MAEVKNENQKCVEHLQQALFQGTALEETALDLIRFDRKALEKAPLRVRLILKGLQAGSSAEEVNASLSRQGFPSLYVRSLPEAVLYYALEHRLTIAQWLELENKAEQLSAGCASDGWFQSGQITMEELERYVLSHSDLENGVPATQNLTVQLQTQLQYIQVDTEFLGFIQNNLTAFSEVREKTRYYFCKYLYYHLLGCVEDYFSAKQAGVAVSFAEARIKTVFRAWTYLDRHRSLNAAQMREALWQSALSLGGIFKSFSFFFFDYITQSWVDLLPEIYGSDFRNVSRRVKELYIKALKQPVQEDLDAGVQRAVMLRESQLDQAAPKERCGETALRKYLRGQLDLDRTTFLCFLLYFSACAPIPAGQKLTEARVDQILGNCGMATLTQGDDFDGFICEFLGCSSQSEAWELVSSEIARYVEAGENSFLYRTYRQSQLYYSQLTQTIQVIKK